MEPTFLKYILKYSWRQQLLLLILTASSFPFLYISLELPKTIVNKAIGSSDFPKTIYGFSFEQVDYLVVMSFIFLAMVLVNGGFKYFINIFKGRVGERMLRRLRYQLFCRVLRFPIPRFRRVSQGEIVAMITAEVEPLGGFIGDAVAQPAFQGGTLLTILIFMFVQDLVLGLAAIALYPLQVYVIPKLQRQVNALAKERVRTVRRLSERIGEAVSSIEEIHLHDTSEFHRADFTSFVGRIYDIRLNIYNKKFFIKFLNNFIAQLTPFFFFLIGGYLVIQGDLTFGALVAVLAAYKDLSSPWKELLDWYQQKEDSRVKYEQLIEQFQPQGMLPEELQGLPTPPIPRLEGTVVATNLTLEEEGGVKLLESATFQFGVGDRVALIGSSGSGADTAAKLLARLLTPTAGNIRIGSLDLAELPEWVTGQRIAYVGASVVLVQGTIRDNLYYPLKHQPIVVDSVGELRAEVKADPGRARSLREAALSGNTTSDLAADWVDYRAAGCDDPGALLEHGIRLLGAVDLEEEIFQFGLNGSFHAAGRPELVDGILAARRTLRQRLQDERYRGLVEHFDRERFNYNLSVAENLLFGRPIGPVFDLDRLAENAYVLSILDLVGLTDRFRRVGVEIAKVILELFEGLPPGHEFFERFSFVDPRLLPELQRIVRQIEKIGLDNVATGDVSVIMSLPFKMVPARHLLGKRLLDEDVEEQLLRARDAFAEHLPVEHRSAIAFFDANAFNVAASIQDNILFGKLVYGRQQSQREIGALIATVIDELGLRRSVLEIGLDFEVGVGGQRLSATQRQRLGLARAMLKKPDLLIVDQAIAGLDPRTQAAIRGRLLERPGDFGVVWLLAEDAETDFFDRIVRFEGGRVVEQRDLRSANGRDASLPTATEASASDET